MWEVTFCPRLLFIQIFAKINFPSHECVCIIVLIISFQTCTIMAAELLSATTTGMARKLAESCSSHIFLSKGRPSQPHSFSTLALHLLARAVVFGSSGVTAVFIYTLMLQFSCLFCNVCANSISVLLRKPKKENQMLLSSETRWFSYLLKTRFCQVALT